MKSNTTYNVTPEKETEKFLTKEQRKNLISNLLNSQKRLTYYNNREVFPDQDYRNFRMDREEENIYKIKTILINNKF